MNAALALQKALRDALAAHGPLGAPVFDHVPQGHAEPYVYFGETETRAAGTKTDAAHDHTVTLHVRSATPGKKQTLDIIEEIGAALDGAALPLAGHRLVTLRVTLWNAQRAGGRVNGLVRLRAFTEPL